MREIKFRGKRFDNHEWVYGSLLVHPFGETDIIPFNTTKAHPVAEYTVGQFTGLKDFWGNEIYDGDILRLNAGDPVDMETVFIVDWNSDYGVWAVSINDHPIGNRPLGQWLREVKLAIVGNIYNALKQDKK